MNLLQTIFLFFGMSVMIGCGSDKDKPACIFKSSGKTASNTYPFNESDRIELVSYESRNGGDPNLVKDGKFMVADIKEMIVLNRSQVDTLISLLYDYERNKDLGPVRHADCYNPRHAVVFYKSGLAIAFWEICLECGGQRHSAKMDLATFCEENICRIQDLFVNIGIKEGLFPGRCGSTGQ